MLDELPSPLKLISRSLWDESENGPIAIGGQVCIRKQVRRS
jgi:hypothetical protein